MTEAEINKRIRLMVMEERARLLSPEDLSNAQTDAINFLAQLLVASAPEYFEKKKSLQPKETNTHIFELPSDCLSLKKVWDYDDNAISITGTADNGSGAIRVTAATHGFEDEEVVAIHDVLGCTEANGTWQIDYVSVNTFDLVGSTFTNAWTSGGKVYLEDDSTYEYPMDRIPSKFQSAGSVTKYFLNEDDVVVDDPTFDNDLIVLYRYLPSTLAEIPPRMHFGIWAYATVNLIHVPAPQVQFDNGGQRIMIYDVNYNTLKKNLEFCQGLWERAQEMAMDFNPVLGSNNISDQKAVKRWI
jgi:hypothetical protein